MPPERKAQPCAHAAAAAATPPPTKKKPAAVVAGVGAEADSKSARVVAELVAWVNGAPFAPTFVIRCEICRKRSTITCRLCQCVYYCSAQCKAKHAGRHNPVCSKRMKYAHIDHRIGFTTRMAQVLDGITAEGYGQFIYDYMEGRSVSFLVKFHCWSADDTLATNDELVNEMAYVVHRIDTRPESLLKGGVIKSPGGISARFVETKTLQHEGRPIDISDNETHMRFEFADREANESVYTDAVTPYAQNKPAPPPPERVSSVPS